MGGARTRHGVVWVARAPEDWDETMATSESGILQVAEKIRQYKADGTYKTLSEQDTKALLVEPLLRIAGWDVGDPMRVSREDRPTERPVDYSLKLQGKPSVLVECKRLSNRLDSRKDLEQALAYAAASSMGDALLSSPRGGTVCLPTVATHRDVDHCSTDAAYGAIRLSDARR